MAYYSYDQQREQRIRKAHAQRYDAAFIAERLAKHPGQVCHGCGFHLDGSRRGHSAVCSYRPHSLLCACSRCKSPTYLYDVIRRNGGLLVVERAS